MGSAMDALKYGGYLTSGLYGSSTGSGLNDSSSAGDNNSSKAYSQMSPASKQYLDSSSKLYGLEQQHQQQQQQQQQQNASHLKASSYTADSLSRSYFDAVQRAGYGQQQQQQQEPGKSYTPDTTASGRASADSPDSSCNTKTGGSNSESQNSHLMLGAEASHQLQQQAAAASFNNHHSHHQAAALQAYYSQNMLSGMSAGHGVNSSGSASSMSNGSSMPGAGLPPLLPMAAQLSQYASAAGSYNSQAAAAAAAAAASGEYRRPLSVLF